MAEKKLDPLLFNETITLKDAIGTLVGRIVRLRFEATKYDQKAEARNRMKRECFDAVIDMLRDIQFHGPTNPIEDEVTSQNNLRNHPSHSFSPSTYEDGVCHFCNNVFANRQAVRAHLKGCAPYLEMKARSIRISGRYRNIMP